MKVLSDLVGEGVGAGASAFAPAAMPFVNASLTVNPAQYGHAEVVVADAGATAASRVLVQLVPNADFDADDLADVGVTASCATGSITMTLHRDGPIVGTYTVTYLLG